MSLIIAHLYPFELGINGDVGNVSVLRRRAEAYGFDVTVANVGRGDELPERVDLVHIGSGPLSSIETVLPDAQRHADQLRTLRDAGVPVLAISGGWQLAGRQIVTEDGRTLPGLGVFPSSVVRGSQYAVEETVLTTPGGTVAGFANHNAVTTLEQGATAFGQVVKGFGNSGVASQDAGGEGVVLGASIGTGLHGSVLALNPVVADGLLAAAIRRTTPGAMLMRPGGEPGRWLDRVDEFARRSREAIIGRVGAQAVA